ncbi:Mannose-1-phosphate guanylyltransferase [Posidoniimonas polymericola]|uniref:mannose-1-phosphate guanylyltransferase n=1 Tax=Posidoniimonas polymericola TaxID=2528002 RepID=A0A5C5YSI4_9BACT|nr:mannose-1-phosphate guanylyltransferase [Posidoniimonas polymericola]TWT77753.1 Mannose-1-phosphate guanylyltransferase [Posidoniimonas polymericola]
MLHAIIMAGGSGTRFWPASRADSPKQMLKLVGDQTMIRQTSSRFGDLIPPERRMVVTNRRLVDGVREQLPELAEGAVVGEPCKRDTAPCIGLAALLVTRVAGDPDATMLVCPADHVIPDSAAFQAAVKQADKLIAESPGRIVTFGIKPTYPAEIFGYIQRSESLKAAGAPAYQVARFVEKPNGNTAAEYLESGDFYWNSGIFVWRAATILDALRERQPAMLEHLELIVDAWNTPDRDALFDQEFTAIEGISIDYAVMEHATDVAVIEAPFEWDDLGGWQSLTRRLGEDENGNTIVGKHLGFNTEGSIVRSSDDHLIVTLGLKDCIVVHTADATLVASKHDEESIRKVVKELEARGWSEHL